MCGFHWDNITQDLIFIFTNRKCNEDLLVNNYLTHITNFDQFATLFREQYLVNKAPTRLSYDVFDVKQ